eukprot:6015068-Alexandrium_andersonii.AAC.1
MAAPGPSPPTIVNVSVQPGASFHLSSAGNAPFMTSTSTETLLRWDRHLGAVVDASGHVLPPPPA